MGGKSSQQQQAQQTTQSAPWAPAQPLLTGVVNQAQGLLPSTGLDANGRAAIDQLIANAQQPNAYSPLIGSYATNLLGGGGANAQAGNVSSNLADFRTALNPYINPGNGIPPELQAQLDTIRNDVTNSVNAQYAGAGRDLSGLNQQTLARGIAQGEAPVIANQYNLSANRAIDAANALYGAGNTTAGILTGLGQQGLANQGAGVDAANAALAAQNAQPGALLAASQIPFQTQGGNLGLLANLGVPIAGLGGTSNRTGSATTTNNPSVLQQAQGWANVFGNLFPSGVTAKTLF